MLHAPPSWIADRRWLGPAMLAGGGAMGLLVAMQPLLGVGLALLMVAALGGLYLVARPWHLFALYLFLLAPHVTLMALLLVHVGLPASAVKAISAWKELTLVAFLGLALWRGRGFRGRVTVPDLVVLLYLLYVGLAFGYALLYERLGLGIALYGLRDHVLPMLLYGVGRSFPLTEGQARTVFRWLLAAALLFSLIGVIEWSVLPTQWHVDLGIPRYYAELQGVTYSPYYRGLPENYWRASSSGLLRRAASIYGSSQSFALSFLLLLPVTLYGMIRRTLPERRWAALAFLLSLAGLVMTITRFTILIGFALIVLGGLISSARARRLVQRSIGLIVLGLLLATATVSEVRLLVVNTLLFRDYSSSSRLTLWWETVQTVMRQPWGYGLGEVGQIAKRFLEGAGAGTPIVWIEGQLSKVVVELGVIGLALYLAILVLVALYALATYYRLSQPYTRGLCFTVVLAFAGMLMNSLTTEWHNSISLVYPAWWLAGSVVALGVHVRRPAPVPPVAPPEP